MWTVDQTNINKNINKYTKWENGTDKALTSKFVCIKCGTRSKDCDNTGLWDNEDDGPCPGKCGFREVTFEGADTAEKNGEWLFTDQHEHFKV